LTAAINQCKSAEYFDQTGTKMDDGGWGIKESELQRFIEAAWRAKEK
jgi:hypothetical protein